MEISERAIETINDLIEINNDRVEGFEKAATDLEENDKGLVAVFHQLAGESRENAAELTCLVQDSGYAPVEGTSTPAPYTVPGSILRPPLPAATGKRSWMNANGARTRSNPPTNPPLTRIMN